MLKDETQGREKSEYNTISCSQLRQILHQVHGLG